MRIISGSCRGRKLAQIQGWDIRPTSDRVREALFNIIGPAISGMRVLDLFAGTGALGLEALSRGALRAVFIDNAPASCTAIGENIARCGMADRSRVLVHDLGSGILPQGLEEGPFDLVFIDPPYRRNLAETVLSAPNFPGLIAPDGMVIVEQDHKESLDIRGSGLDIYRQKKYSKTLLSFLQHRPPAKG